MEEATLVESIFRVCVVIDKKMGGWMWMDGWKGAKIGEQMSTMSDFVSLCFLEVLRYSRSPSLAVYCAYLLLCSIGI